MQRLSQTRNVVPHVIHRDWMSMAHSQWAMMELANCQSARMRNARCRGKPPIQSSFSVPVVGVAWLAVSIELFSRACASLTTSTSLPCLALRPRHLHWPYFVPPAASNPFLHLLGVSVYFCTNTLLQNGMICHDE